RHTTPPACASRPVSGLNFTSTSPSARDASDLTHQGKVPLPDCLSTLGLLGADMSASTDHLGEPRPVTPARQPAGSAPGVSRSNETVSACVVVIAITDARVGRISASAFFKTRLLALRADAARRLSS